MTQPLACAPSRSFTPLIFSGAGLALLLWAYGSTLEEVAWRWAHDPQYSHGWLVPVFAGFLLWLRRERLCWGRWSPSAFGLAVVAAATALRLAGSYYHFAWLDQMSFLGCLAGLAVAAGGGVAWRWAWPALAFLAFMIPLPHSLSVALSGPMQTFATISSTFCLQVLGKPALAEGNVILLNDIELGIVEACSGLRMLVVFFALSTAVALLVRKPLWEKITVAASAIPIALVVNVLRITFTGVIYEMVGAERGQAIFHDVMGWVMMPMAMAFLGLELWIFQRLLVEPSTRIAAQVVYQRVAVGPVALYGQEAGQRREAAAHLRSSTQKI